MEGLQGTSTAAQAGSMLKDVSDAKLVTKTLDKLNTAQTLSGPKIDADYQFRKDVLAAAGIGKALDAMV